MLITGLQGSHVRLAFASSAEISMIGSFSGSARAIAGTTPTAAAISALGDVREAVATHDGISAWLMDSDTLSLAFTVPAAMAGMQRSSFLEVSGRRVTLGQATATRLRQAGGEAPTPTVRFSLHQNKPNPALRSTLFRFDLPRATTVKLEVMDLLGRRVKSFAQALPAGPQQIAWDLRNSRGESVAPGIYLYRRRAGPDAAQRKMVVLP